MLLVHKVRTTRPAADCVHHVTVIFHLDFCVSRVGADGGESQGRPVELSHWL